MSHRPKISIITPSYNSSKFIEDAILSVGNQSYNNKEHIVVDGESTDDTIDILESYSSVRYISKSDNGIYDALNKGIKMADGDYIGWLNADDIYTNNAFEAYLDAFQKSNSPDIITGDSDLFSHSDSSKKRLQKFEFTNPDILSKGIIDQSTIGLNACLISTKLIDSIGKFDPAYQIAGDAEFLYRIASSKPDAVGVNQVVYRYRSHKESLTFSSQNSDQSIRIQSEAKLIGSKEYLEFLPNYFRNNSVPEQIREYAIEQYRERYALLLEFYLRRANLVDFVVILYQIFKSDPMWYFWILQKANSKLYNKLRID